MITPDTEIIADRFLRTAHRCIDLASGETVRLDLSDAPDRCRLGPWMERSAALWECRHPHLVPLEDYGPVGPCQVFEALRMPVPSRRWRARDESTRRAIGSAVGFLHAEGLSAGHLVSWRIVEIGRRPMLVPDGDTGWPLDTAADAARRGRSVPNDARCREGAQLERLFGCGASTHVRGTPVPRSRGTKIRRASAGGTGSVDEIAKVIELLETGRHGEPRRIQLRGRPLAAIAAAVRVIAREARLRGFIPVSTACLALGNDEIGVRTADALVRLLRERHALVIHGLAAPPVAKVTDAIRLLLELATASCRPHILLCVDARSSSAGTGIHVSAGAAPYGTSPVARPTGRRPTIEGAAIWPSGEACGKAGESRAHYGVVGAPSSEGCGDGLAAAEGTPLPCRFQALGRAGDSRVALERARSRSVEGMSLAKRGRHAAGERLLREAAGALARRGDEAWAGRTALDLGRLLHWRGRVREAARAFEQARTLFDRCSLAAASIRATVYLGLVWTDSARLLDAEAALRAALIAATEAGSHDAREFARLGLARCLVWQRRWEEASAMMADRGAGDCSCPAVRGNDGSFDVPGGAHRPRSNDVTQCRESNVAWAWDTDLDASVIEACLASRIALGRCDVSTAGLSATRARERARRSTEARDLAAACTAAARVHAEIADIDGLRQHVREGLRAAACAHAPLEALRLRLLLVDGLRKAGRTHEGDRLARRLGRLRTESLPPLLRLRVDAVARGEPSSAIGLAGSPDATPTSAGRPGRAAAPATVRDLRLTVDLVAEIVELVQACHDAGDESALLDRVGSFLRQQTRASSIAFFANEPSGLSVVASVGSRPFPLQIARRAGETGLFVTPADPSDRSEAAVPVRHAGVTIGALACRWPIDVRPDESRIKAMLSTAATLAAPSVRAALDRRACPLTVAAAEPDLMGVAEAMTELRTAIARAAATPFPVLIEGESGSGKELVARAIHRLSARRDRQCCTLNCAALTDELFEAELFGHARGAFTGAVGERAGLLEEADGGTLVLDEVRELSQRAQAKLLRALQEGEVRRVGENFIRRVDVRFVAATNRPLQEEVAAGQFRRDLFFRLNVIRVAVPPLRERIEDIPVLAAHFWSQAVARTGSRATLAPATITALARHDWPGNVRELQNVMAALAVSAPRRGSVGPGSLPPTFTTDGTVPHLATLGDARRNFEARYVRAALARAGGHRGRAAHDLGLTRQGFAKVLARLRVDRECLQ